MEKKPVSKKKVTAKPDKLLKKVSLKNKRVQTAHGWKKMMKRLYKK